MLTIQSSSFEPICLLRKSFCTSAVWGFFEFEVNKVGHLLHVGNRCVLKKAN